MQRNPCGKRRLVDIFVAGEEPKKEDGTMGIPMSLMWSVSLGGGYFDVDVPLLDADGLA